MEVGDLVIRAYAHSSGTSPGIIIEVYDEEIGGCEIEGKLISTMFVVQWPDGTQSREMYEELYSYEFYVDGKQ